MPSQSFFWGGANNAIRDKFISPNYFVFLWNEHRYVFDENLPTGCCVAIVRPDGTRCLAANIGAAREFSMENLESINDVTDLIDRARVLYIEGFFASHSPDVAMAALIRGHSRCGLVRLFSLSAQYICLQSHSLLR